ncbi:ATP-grasp domain-containing protein [Pseudomonas gingeri]|uniref:acetyl/propionyl/methylcrotonyl-CoA carboxylase subunit alpha n=1 Tax=Pseudomonas gingeri TaxID=117681 RepID=UPI0015B80DEC|nr:biotin carboxylase N-terminal domain-containing protein [Pseudomonas gingeri]NWE68817.1 ATP-grasp domain-containing protein [Pseudomonas gingeri]
MFDTLLIANRGAIACRLLRTLRELEVKGIAVYSEADITSRHILEADLALSLGEGAAADTYLATDKILAAARASGAQAIHPGYGFLSENADFAEACEAAGIAFVGPTPEQLRLFGLKHTARALARQHGVPLLEGSDLLDSLDDALHAAAHVGYPIMLKSTAGGGGIGMRVCRSAEALREAFETVKRLGQNNFSNAGVFIEKYIQRARHLEVQVFGDGAGEVLALGVRDCSVQRRNQKVLEETPAPNLPEGMAEALCAAAVQLAKAVRYRSAGTVEFVFDSDERRFYFLEVNTRLQVEHPVTEAITGLDLVAWQIRVASGEALPISQEQVPLLGHAIEVRLYAEDPGNDFLPATGRLEVYRESAAGPGRRVDSGVAEGDSVSPFYDPMLGKLIAWGETREQARLRLLAMLDEFAVGGLKTNLGFLRRIIGHPAFAAAELDTGFIPRYQEQLLPAAGELCDEFWQVAARAWSCGLAATPRADDPGSPWASGNGFRGGLPAETALHLSCRGEDRALTLVPDQGVGVEWHGESLSIERQGIRRRYRAIRQGDNLYLQWQGELLAISAFDPIAAVEASHGHQGGLTAPMNGNIVRVLVQVGQSVEAGTQLVVLEAMKMEHSIRAPQAGVVKALYCQEGEMVSEGSALVELQE